ncbi:hypothetical protein DOM22_11695 [Bdellovibrio sp. ZAP7]|uniref:hypothetical protein n=1 Tax=Bdellovibrio sp. ZAP7 TaxID=2231053 RepID=UPI00115A35FE|nr:hypothetical protein [Bdellovibrio sp. ZAP7]QDK45762.1 hypothetical protein DOM22_11695 [Bdellovibrio sp. ZAP7]
MKAFLMIVLLGFGINARADQVFSIRACSSYFKATIEDHAKSAQQNFTDKANRTCQGLGSLTWDVIESQTHSAFNVPVYCISGKILCYQ